MLLVLAGHEPGSQQQAAQRLGVDRTTMVALLDVLEGQGSGGAASSRGGPAPQRRGADRGGPRDPPPAPRGGRRGRAQVPRLTHSIGRPAAERRSPYLVTQLTGSGRRKGRPSPCRRRGADASERASGADGVDLGGLGVADGQAPVGVEEVQAAGVDGQLEVWPGRTCERALTRAVHSALLPTSGIAASSSSASWARSAVSLCTTGGASIVKITLISLPSSSVTSASAVHASASLTAWPASPRSRRGGCRG